MEEPCKGFTYNVTLLHYNHTISYVTNNTTHIFNDTSMLQGGCSVNVFAFNENARGDPDREEAVTQAG